MRALRGLGGKSTGLFRVPPIPGGICVTFGQMEFAPCQRAALANFLHNALAAVCKPLILASFGKGLPGDDEPFISDCRHKKNSRCRR